MATLNQKHLYRLVVVLVAVVLAACSGLGPAGASKPGVQAAEQSAAQKIVQNTAPGANPAPASAEQKSVPLTGAGQTFQVEIVDNEYHSAELVIPTGAKVVWTNTGQNKHTVSADDGSFNSGDLAPGASYSFTFNQVGVFVYHCNFHGQAGGHGMTGAVVVQNVAYAVDPAVAAVGSAGSAAAGANAAANADAAPQGKGVKRIYYIAAVEEEWNYAPSDQNLIKGQPFGDTENVFVQQGDERIGHIYTKALYREFTDDTFSTPKPVAPEWQHLGIMGPTLHAEVGDQIVIYFKNKTSIPTSMHPHGVFYKKDSEGAGYSDNTSGADKADDAVPPGGTHTYTWDVPDRAGPGPMDPSSIMWMYHSHVDEPGDTNAGLMGAIVVTARGKARPDGTPKDVDREFVVTFSVLDENSSPLLQHNIDTKTGKPETVHTDDEGFEESNLMHSINGYVYGNLPGLKMKVGEHVRWYVMGMGTEVDLHTPHWHGNVVTYQGMRMDVIELLPASMKVVDMVPDNPGVWLLHCHVNDHIIAGMQATFTVEP